MKDINEGSHLIYTYWLIACHLAVLGFGFISDGLKSGFLELVLKILCDTAGNHCEHESDHVDVESDLGDEFAVLAAVK